MSDLADVNSPDMLQCIFSLQAALNDKVFSVQDLRDEAGALLRMATISKQVRDNKFSVNQLPNQWLSRYARAMEAEIDELKADLLWKWWSKDTIDLQNIRVELVDILHFLVSAMLCAGLSAEEAYDIYVKKHSVNVMRQETGYSQANKTEADNRSIQ